MPPAGDALEGDDAKVDIFSRRDIVSGAMDPPCSAKVVYGCEEQPSRCAFSGADREGLEEGREQLWQLNPEYQKRDSSNYHSIPDSDQRKNVEIHNRRASDGQDLETHKTAT